MRSKYFARLRIDTRLNLYAFANFFESVLRWDGAEVGRSPISAFVANVSTAAFAELEAGPSTFIVAIMYAYSVTAGRCVEFCLPAVMVPFTDNMLSAEDFGVRTSISQQLPHDHIAVDDSWS